MAIDKLDALLAINNEVKCVHPECGWFSTTDKSTRIDEWEDVQMYGEKLIGLCYQHIIKKSIPKPKKAKKEKEVKEVESTTENVVEEEKITLKPELGPDFDKVDPSKE